MSPEDNKPAAPKVGLVREIINGRHATVGYLTHIGGKFTTPDLAEVVMVVYDDGGRETFVPRRAPQTERVG